MFKFAAPVKYLAIFACALVLVDVCLAIPYVDLTRMVVNTVSSTLTAHAGRVHHGAFLKSFASGPMKPILFMLMLMAGMVILGGVNTFLRNIVNMRLSMDMVYTMRAAAYDKLQHVGFGFHDQHSSGMLINRALTDLHNIRAFVNTAMLSTIDTLGYVIGYNILLASINKWVALAALLPVPFWIWYITKFSKRMQPVQQKVMEAGDDVVTTLTESVAGVHVVKAFATEKTEIGKYNAASDRLYDRNMEAVRLTSNFVPAIRGIASFSHLTLFALGAVLVARGQLQVGDFLVFGTAMGVILSRLQQINVVSDQYQKAVVSGRRFFEMLDAPATVDELPGAPDLPPGPGAVEFAFVTFGYQADRPVVHDITFEAPGGSVIALVGPTGAGKSTLMQLLSRFYDPQAGAILVDGKDVRKVNLSSLRRSVGFVFQETFLFSDTVAANIRYGHPHATDGQVEAAAHISQAHEFITELPDGYNTMLGERGATLSGGQRQRLAIARAVVMNPRILVLDDALAAVDPETERSISRALELVMVDRTVFVIAHRLSTVKAANLVIVLEDGHITQAGTHQELVRQDGHYRWIAQAQLAYDDNKAMPWMAGSPAGAGAAPQGAAS